jgi:hypothetical protein
MAIPNPEVLMTSTATCTAYPAADPMPVVANAVPPLDSPVVVSGDAVVVGSGAGVDADAVGRIVAEAAREITGVCAEVQVRADVARGAAVLSMRVPIRYPMPVWRVTTACRALVLERMRERCGIPVRRLDIEVGELAELVR